MGRPVVARVTMRAVVLAVLASASCGRDEARLDPDCPDGARAGLCVRFSTPLVPAAPEADAAVPRDAAADATN